MNRAWSRAALLVVFGSLVLACGGGDDGGEDTAPTDAETEQETETVEAAGGLVTFTLPPGWEVEDVAGTSRSKRSWNSKTRGR